MTGSKCCWLHEQVDLVSWVVRCTYQVCDPPFLAELTDHPLCTSFRLDLSMDIGIRWAVQFIHYSHNMCLQEREGEKGKEGGRERVSTVYTV